MNPVVLGIRDVLCDSGPLAALFNSNDSYHSQALAYFKRHGAHVRLHTTWEVVSEVMYFLDFSAHAQADLLQWLHDGATRDRVRIAALLTDDLLGLATLMRKYADRPMDLADASLVWLANRVNITDIITVDGADFSVYRTDKRKAFKNVFDA
jgi:predicted nucleic acid-binding protein